MCPRQNPNGNCYISITTHNQRLKHDPNEPESLALARYATIWKNIDAANPEYEEYYRKTRPELFIVSIPDQEYYRTQHSNSEPLLIGSTIEYRTEGLASMKITADKSVFGEEPGASLNRHFYVAEYYHSAPFSYPDLVLWPDFRNEDKSKRNIDKLVEFKPYLPWIFDLLSIQTLSQSEIMDIEWTVEMTTTSGKYFKISHRGTDQILEPFNSFGGPYLDEFMSEATLVK